MPPKRPNNHRPERPSLEACGSFGRWFVSVATGRLSRPGRKHDERARMAVERPFGFVSGMVSVEWRKTASGRKREFSKRLRSESPKHHAPTAGTDGPFSSRKAGRCSCGTPHFCEFRFQVSHRMNAREAAALPLGGTPKNRLDFSPGVSGGTLIDKAARQCAGMTPYSKMECASMLALIGRLTGGSVCIELSRLGTPL